MHVKETRKMVDTAIEQLAAVVCEGIGLNAGTSSCDYIKLYDGKKETLIASLDRIRDVAGEILAAVSHEARRPDVRAMAVASHDARTQTVAGDMQAWRIAA